MPQHWYVKGHVPPPKKERDKKAYRKNEMHKRAITELYYRKKHPVINKFINIYLKDIVV